MDIPDSNLQKKGCVIVYIQGRNYWNGTSYHYTYMDLIINNISGNTGTGNGNNCIYFRTVNFSGNNILNTNELPYRFLNTFIREGNTLIIQPGVLIKLLSFSDYYRTYYGGINVLGNLQMNGLVYSPIVVTSFHDDSYGGDSDNNGSTVLPTNGDWGFISVEGNGRAYIDNAIFRYGGGSRSSGTIAFNGEYLNLTNSVISFSEYYGVYVKKQNHYINGNSFENLDTNYEAVFNADIENISVNAENNWWGASNGPDPHGDGEGINYRTCLDPVTETYYVCEYYVDAVPWIGMDDNNSNELIEEALPAEPNRNTAAMEPGVPYIEYVRSTANFFYFGAEYTDGMEIKVDWNGSDEGRGIPGKIKISVDGLDSWQDIIIDNTTELGGYASINPQLLKIGFNDLKFSAYAADSTNSSDSNTQIIRAIRFSAPGWLISLGFDGTSVKVTHKPNYTEFEFKLKVPKEAEKTTFFSNEIPFLDTFSPASLQWNGELVFRSTGYGEFKSGLKYTLGESATDYDITTTTGTSSNLSAKIYIFLDGSGVVQLPWNGEGLSADFDFEMGIGGEVAKKESILVLIPGIGTAISGLSRVPIASQIVNAVYIEGKIEPEISLSTGITANFSDNEIKWKNVSLTGKTKITLTAGVELYDFLEASIYGGGEISPEFCLTPFEWKKTTSALFVGAKFKAFSTWEVEREERWEFVDVNPDANCITDLPIPNDYKKITKSSMDSSTLSEWKIEEPIYKDSPYSDFSDSKINTQILDENQTQALSDTIVISNLYESASPSLTIRNDNAVLMWVHDDINLGETQSKELMASSWNGFSWSAPTQVTDNLMVDFNPQLAFIDNAHVMAVWQQINDATIPDNTTLTNEIGQKVELVYAVYDLNTGEWTTPSFITNDTTLDHRVKIMAGIDGSVMITWIQNAAGQLFGASTDPDKIKFGFWNGTAWDIGDVTGANISSLVSIDSALYSTNEGIIVLSKGKSGDLTSMNDLELYYSVWNGSSWSDLIVLTSNTLIDDSPSINYTSTGERSLIWLQNSGLMMLGDDWSLSPSSTKVERDGYLLRNFETAIDKNDNIALIWSGMATEGSDLFFSLYDSQNGSWLLAEKLTNSDALEKQTSASFNGSGQLMVAYALDNMIPETIIREGIEIPNVMQYQSTDLHVLNYTPDSDLTVSDLSLPYRPNPEPGETVLVQANIVNSGDWSVDNPTISFYDGDPSLGGILIGTYNHIGYITAGASITVDMQWLVPSNTVSSRSVYVIVDPDNLIDERDETNNQINVKTVLPDLTISSVSSYYYDQHIVVPLAVIYNSGKLSTENVLVQFREGTIDGPIVYSEVVPLIEKEGMVAVSTELNVQGWNPGSYKYYVTIDENMEIEEVDDTNNTDYFSIAVMPDLVIYAGDITATLQQGIGGQVDVTVRNWGTFDAVNFTVKLYEGPEIDLSKTPLKTWTVPTLAVDGVTTLTTTIDHIPYNLFAIVDPDDVYEEIDESNNVSYEDLPIVHGSPVVVVGASDPNLADIIYSPGEFGENTGTFDSSLEANIVDVSLIAEAPQLCDISLITEFTGLQGKIALIEKSSQCAYDTQVNNAGLLGALGVLIYNDLTGDNSREVMTGLPVIIPAGFLPRQDGLDLAQFNDQLVRIGSDDEAVTILDHYK